MKIQSAVFSCNIVTTLNNHLQFPHIFNCLLSKLSSRQSVVMFLLFSTKIVVIVSAKCPVFLKMTTMLRTSTTAQIQAPACMILVENTLALSP